MMQARNRKGQTLDEFLAAYDAGRYPRPSVTVDMTVFTLLQKGAEAALGILLIKRKDHPFIGRWALPGGFLNMDESLAAAAARELEEETGVKGLIARQFHTFGAVERDPRTRVITVGHLAIAPPGTLRPQAGDDAAEAELFSLSPGESAGSALSFHLDGPTQLTVQAEVRADALGRVLAPCATAALASDHDAVLIAGLCALVQLDQERCASLLGQGGLEQEARCLLRLYGGLLEGISA